MGKEVDQSVDFGRPAQIECVEIVSRLGRRRWARIRRVDRASLSGLTIALGLKRAAHPLRAMTGRVGWHPVSPRAYPHFPFGPRGSMVSGRQFVSVELTRNTFTST